MANLRFARLIEPLESRLLFATGTMATLSPEGEASDPLTIEVGSDLDGANGFTLNGIDPDDDSGRSVSSAGDINGDGFDDLLIGADGARPNGILSGETYVVFGAATGFPAALQLDSLNGDNGFVLNGAAANDRSGLAVSSADDVNGDGIDDLLIGASGATGADENSGRSYVVFGSSEAFAPSIELASLDGSNGFAIDGAAASDFSGVAVSGAGDVNGDGFADVIVGAPYVDPGGRDKAGAAYIVFGTPQGFPAAISLANLDGGDGVTLRGVSAGDQAGFAVSEAGDVNGDGIGDVIIGTYDASPQGASSGESYVVFGQLAFPAGIELSTLDGSNGFAIRGSTAGDQLGRAVSQAGDLNGDGFSDVIIGGPGARQSAGDAFVVFGKSQGFSASIDVADLDGSLGFAVRGVAPGDEAGRAVSGLGDINADGFDDLILGAPFADSQALADAGASYIVFGRASFTASVSLGDLDAATGITLHGAAAGDLLGLAVSGAGDVNGDGLNDVLVAAPAAVVSSNLGAGKSYLLFGADHLGAITQRGDQTANALVGDPGANTIVGGADNDSLTGGGGADSLLGGQGDDTLVVADAVFRELAGGNGNDTLRVDGSGSVLDLTQIPDGRVSGIERIDITGSGGNALVMNLREVLNLSDTSNRVIVRADANDSVVIGDGWLQDGAESVDDEFYDVFRQGAAEVLILISDHPPWQNQVNRLDVDNDTFVAPVDVLLVINEINNRRFSDGVGRLPDPPTPDKLPPPFVDVDGDGFVVPVDVLLVINFLNNVSGEGEAAGSVFYSPANPPHASQPAPQSRHAPARNAMPKEALPGRIENAVPLAELGQDAPRLPLKHELFLDDVGLDAMYQDLTARLGEGGRSPSSLQQRVSGPEKDFVG